MGYAPAFWARCGLGGRRNRGNLLRDVSLPFSTAAFGVCSLGLARIEQHDSVCQSDKVTTRSPADSRPPVACRFDDNAYQGCQQALRGLKKRRAHDAEFVRPCDILPSSVMMPVMAV